MMIIIKVKIISHLKIGLRKDHRIHLFQKRKVNPHLDDILNMKRKRIIQNINLLKVNFNFLGYSLIQVVEIDLLIKIMIKLYIQ